MDRLWTPWRYAYITGEDKAGARMTRNGVPAVLAAWPGDLGCIFCNMVAAVDYAVAHGMPSADAEKAAFIVHRGKDCFICLNAYPYTSGHVLVLPYQHLDSLAELPAPAAQEMMQMMQALETALRATYKPAGINFGINLGEAAGAGVASHVHMHGLPRWVGDSNFMTVVGETRVLPETLDVTWARLREALSKLV